MKDVSDGTHLPEVRRRPAPSGYRPIKSMTGSDNGKTVTVVMKTPFADWQSMFGAAVPGAHRGAARWHQRRDRPQRLVPVVRQERPDLLRWPDA